MHFNVKFVTEDGSDIIETLGKPGIDMLDSIRETYPKLMNVKADNITLGNECPVASSKYNIILSEDDARRSGRFRGNTTVKVTVPYGWFTKYVFLDAHFYYTETNNSKIPWLYSNKKKHINGASIDFTVDKEKIIKDWITAGSSDRWGFNE